MLTNRNQDRPAASPLTVAVVGRDPALNNLVMGALVVYGAEPRHGLVELAETLSALIEGELDRLVCIGPSLPAPVALELQRRPAIARAVFLVQLPGGQEGDEPAGVQRFPWPVSLRDLTDAVIGSRSEGTPHVYEFPSDEIPCPRLLGLVALLSPDIKLIVETDLRSLAVCFSRGRIRAIGLEGAPLSDLEGLRLDPAVGLLLSHWAPPAISDEREVLAREVGFLCEYGDLFVSCDAYRRHAVQILAWLLCHPIRSYRVERHRPTARGFDTIEVLREAMTTLNDRRLRAWLAEARAQEPRDRVHDRASHRELVERVIEELSGPLFEPPLPDPRGSAPRGRLSSRRRRRSRTGRRCRVKTRAGLRLVGPEEIRCGDPSEFFSALREVHERVAESGGSLRLPNTRFEPIGMDLGDLLLFFRVGYGHADETFLGLQKQAGGQHRVVMVCRLREPIGDLSLRHPNIVRSYELRQHNGHHLLVTEFVHGVSVTELTRRLTELGRPVPIDLVRWIGGAAAGALYWAHHLNRRQKRPGFTRHQMSADSILIGFDGSVKLLGVGTRRADRGDASGSGEDLRGIGCALHAMLSGVPVGDGCGVPLRELRPELPADLVETVEQSLATHNGRRFEHCGELRDALLVGVFGGFDPVSKLALTLDQALSQTKRHEAEMINRMRHSGAALFRRAYITI